MEAKERKAEAILMAQSQGTLYLDGDEHPDRYILSPKVATDLKGRMWSLPDGITGMQLRETINKYGLPEEPILERLKSTDIMTKEELIEFLEKLNLGVSGRPRNSK